MSRSTLDSFRARLGWLGLGAFILFSLAFQVPYTYHINIGDSSDRQFVSGGIYLPETLDGRSFRWTRRRAGIEVPALAGGDWKMTLTLDGWQPRGPASVTVLNGDAPLFQFVGDLAWNAFAQTIQWTPFLTGDPTFVLDTPTFRPAREIRGSTDARTLGIKLDDFELAPSGLQPRLPPLIPYVLPLTAVVLLCSISIRGLGFAPEVALLGGAIGVILIAAVIGFFRIYLNIALVQVLLTLSVANILWVFLGVPFLGRFWKRAELSTSDNTLKWLGLVIGAALTIKVVGVFYPQIQIIDALFHLHRLEFARAGNLFFAEPARQFGGLDSVYPPGFYVLLTPLALLFPDPLTLVKLVPILLQVISGLVLYFIARRGGLSERASLLAVVLYEFVPVSLLALSWGTYANIFGAELLLWTLAIWLALNWDTHPVRKMLVLAFLFYLNILAHASMLPTLIVFWTILLLATAIILNGRRRAAWTAGAFALALGLAFAVYFSYFSAKTAVDLIQLQNRSGAEAFVRVIGSGVAAADLGLMPVRVTSMNDWVVQGLLYFVQEAWVYYAVVPLALAVVGVLAMTRDGGVRQGQVIVAAGMATLALFYLVGWLTGLYTRYMFIAAAFVALGAAYAVDRAMRSSRLGHFAALVGLALFMVYSLQFWVWRVLE